MNKKLTLLQTELKLMNDVLQFCNIVTKNAVV